MNEQNQPVEVPYTVTFEGKIKSGRIPELLEVLGGFGLEQTGIKLQIGENGAEAVTGPTYNAKYLENVTLPNGNASELLVTRDTLLKFAKERELRPELAGRLYGGLTRRFKNGIIKGQFNEGFAPADIIAIASEWREFETIDLPRNVGIKCVALLNLYSNALISLPEYAELDKN